MSSPVLATTVRCSRPTTSCMPRASLAPPVPPARTTTWLAGEGVRGGSPAPLPSPCGAPTPTAPPAAPSDGCPRGPCSAEFTAISIAVSDSVVRAISRRPQSTQRSPSICCSSAAASRLSARASPHTSTSCSSAWSRSVSEAALIVCRALDHAHTRARHLLRLLRGRALPDAEHARRLAAHRGRKRHRRVDQQLSLAPGALEVGQRLRLAAERARSGSRYSAWPTASAFS